MPLAPCWEGKTVSPRSLVLCSVLLCASCVHHPHRQSAPYEDNIRYVSFDRSRVSSFHSNEARVGVPWALEGVAPLSPVRYLELGASLSCISIGPTSGSLQLAIKRPIQIGDEYYCLQSRFKVEKCIDECKSAIIAIFPVSQKEFSGQYRRMIVNQCVGVIAIEEGVAEKYEELANFFFLAGDGGLLKDRRFPVCIGE